MRHPVALLARRLATSVPGLLAGGAAGAASGLPGGAAALAPAATIGARAWHATATPFAAAAEAASTSSSSSSSGPLNARTECGDVPEGHKETDLAHHVNNIGLGRRRDLTLRPDVRLHGPTGAGAGQQLAALLKVSLEGCVLVRRRRRGAGARAEKHACGNSETLRPSTTALPTHVRSLASSSRAPLSSSPPPPSTQGKRAVIFGVPDMGDVCTNKHVPSFLEQVRRGGRENWR